ncbi:major facilitator superfamily domain-containing protein [Hypoxylon trugodes]|uniref:major facilitator superfamily domain-containing protein n=1 Tax=Hypoxylon trugodes TaxID=326681 RepID=UPI0021A11F05|nr:major facilitator superfamily domain-containing protein [Hypoxylon trugodes]KAI1393508.1 major facilitator superfamily domain-containing protein [Hypoxylon trugodes]
MEGIRGLSSWRWVFILEGIATVLIGIASFLCITDFPQQAKWLSREEREFLLKTRADESPITPITTEDILAFFTKPEHWFGALMYFSLLVLAYSIVYFLPTIVQALGYSTVQTQLHSVPPFAAAFGFAVVVAYMSDKCRMRSPFIFFGLALLITGLAILICVRGAAHFSVEYAALCLIAMGSFGVGGNIVCWYIMNLRGHVKRSIGSAWMIGFGNIGGVISTFLFVKKDTPYYHSGYSVCLAMAALCVFSCAGYGLLVRKEIAKDKKLAGGDLVKEPLYL